MKGGKKGDPPHRGTASGKPSNEPKPADAVHADEVERVHDEIERQWSKTTEELIRWSNHFWLPHQNDGHMGLKPMFLLLLGCVYHRGFQHLLSMGTFPFGDARIHFLGSFNFRTISLGNVCQLVLTTIDMKSKSWWVWFLMHRLDYPEPLGLQTKQSLENRFLKIMRENCA